MPQTVREAVAAARRAIRLEIRDAIVNRDDLSYTVIGRLFGVSWWTVQQVANEFGVKRGQGVGGGRNAKLVPRDSNPTKT
jgi:hypothetical protein